MARTINARRSTRQDEGTKQRDLIDQPTPFLGIAVAPLLAILLSWALHYAVSGMTVFGHRWFNGSQSALGGVIILITLGAVAVSYAAWHFSYDRKPVWRYTLTGTAFVTVLWMALLVWVGPQRMWDTFFAVFAWIASTVWALPRLHVLRRDPREDTREDGDGDELMKQLGLTGYRKTGEPSVTYDQHGDPARIDVEIKHRFGGTRKPLQDAIDSLASALGTKDGFVRVTVPDDGKSNKSHITAVLKDPFTGRVPNLGPSHPGGSVTDYAHVGMYDDGEPVYVWVFGGKDPATGDPMNPTGYAFMGMTRAGKTVTENRLLIDGVITRRDGVILYLNKAKGGQDVQPIIAGVEAAVLSDSSGDYRHALARVKDIMTYRQKQLARYGIAAWSAEKCFDNPPQQTLDGKPIPMEPMSTLVVHVGEADSILAEAGEEAVYLASKGLSLGVIPGWSMQRWSATSMPTDLRFNIGCSFCFGVGDDYSAGFALSEQTIKAGAHPEYWKNRKPGMFYVENIGIPESRFPVPAKGIGDTDNDALYTNMRLTCEEWGPRMAKLDKGSRDATRGWWDKIVRETDLLRAQLTPGNEPAAPADPGTPTQQEEPMAPRPQAYAAPFNADPPTADEDAAAMEADQLTRAEIADTREVNDKEIFGELVRPDDTDGPNDDYFAEVQSANTTADIPTPPRDDIDLDGPKPEALSRQEAELAFDNAIRTVHADPNFRDPDDPSGRTAVVRTGQLQDVFPFRARSWYSPILAEMASGERMCPPGIRVERMTDRTGEGWYRLIDTAGEPSGPSGNAE